MRKGTTKYKEVAEAAQACNKAMIGKDVVETTKLAVMSLMDHEISRKAIEAKKAVQIPLRWTDRKTKLPIRGFVDFETEIWGEEYIVDLKSAGSGGADPRKFMRQCIDLDYHLQAGTYAEGYHKTRFKWQISFAWLVVETVEPFDVSLIHFADIHKAKEEFHGTLQRFRYCMKNDLFSESYDFRVPHNQGMFNEALPGWYKSKMIGFDETE